MGIVYVYMYVLECMWALSVVILLILLRLLFSLEAKHVHLNFLFFSSARDNTEKLQEKFNDEQLRYEETHLGNFRRIYPLEGTDRYNKFFCTSSSVYQETATFRAHTQCARLDVPFCAFRGCLIV